MPSSSGLCHILISRISLQNVWGLTNLLNLWEGGFLLIIKLTTRYKTETKYKFQTRICALKRLGRKKCQSRTPGIFRMREKCRLGGISGAHLVQPSAERLSLSAEAGIFPARSTPPLLCHLFQDCCCYLQWMVSSPRPIFPLELLKFPALLHPFCSYFLGTGILGLGFPWDFSAFILLSHAKPS